MAAAKRIWRYNIEGALIDVPQTYDQRCRVYLDAFPDLIEKPVYTPAGERVLLTIEDACPMRICSRMEWRTAALATITARPPARCWVCVATQPCEGTSRKGGEERMKKRILAVLLCLCMVLTMLPVSALAAVGGLLNNTPEQNETLLEKLQSFTGESPEEALELLDSMGLLDEDGNLITDQTIDLDGKQHTLEEMEALLEDPSADLSQVAYADGVPIALGDLKTVIAIERELQHLQETYFSGKTFDGEARENLNSLVTQLQTAGIAFQSAAVGDTHANVPSVNVITLQRLMWIPGNRLCPYRQSESRILRDRHAGPGPAQRRLGHREPGQRYGIYGEGFCHAE